MKRTGDIWGVPPGGFESKPKRGPGLRIVVACTLVLLLGVGGGIMVRSMRASTEVSTEDALAQFRADKAARAGGSQNDAGAGAAKSSKPKKPTDSNKAASRRATEAQQGSGSAPVAAPAEQGGGSGPTQRRQTGSSSNAGTTRVPDFRPPKEGVYQWDVDGYEKAPGVTRQLPKRSHRVINHAGDDRWVEHHIFSEQKEQWFHLGGSQEGVYSTAVRNRVEIGPVEADETVTFDPVMFVSRFPFKVGQTWQGRWEGDTSGSYTGKTLDHGTLVIDGEKVEVWVTEVKMEMHGDVEGTATTRSWVAPDYSLVVKQYQETRIASGPGDYYCEWEGQVRSLHPQT